MRFKLVVQYDTQTHATEIIDVDAETIPSDLTLWSWDHFEQLPIYAPADVPLPHHKFDSHFNHKRKVEFESVLAYSILKNSFLFLPLLHRIGSKIKTLIVNAEHQIADENKKKQFRYVIGKIFRHVLYPSDNAHFGRISSRDNAPHCEEIYRTGLTILGSEKKIERLLTVFLVAESILKNLNANAEILQTLEKIRSNENMCRNSGLFHNRGRHEINKTRELSTRLGIGDSSLQLPYQIDPHSRPIEHMQRDHTHVSTFAFNAYQKEIPFIAGPSAHTAKLMAAIMPLCQDFSLDEQQQYALCCSGFLIAAGAHSFHETQSVAKLFHLPYEEGCYSSALPASFIASEAYQRLLQKFPDIIKANTTEPLQTESQSTSEPMQESKDSDSFIIKRPNKRKPSDKSEKKIPDNETDTKSSASAAASSAQSCMADFNSSVLATPPRLRPSNANSSNYLAPPTPASLYQPHGFQTPTRPAESRASSLPMSPYSGPVSGSHFSLFNSPNSIAGSNLFSSPVSTMGVNLLNRFDNMEEADEIIGTDDTNENTHSASLESPPPKRRKHRSSP
ncbi:MAG: hypothetical protein P4M14_02420 [Gammaproteobacteria bacterium]|nr:hypothetical protein [Gammaproteobacteria bacterium]